MNFTGESIALNIKQMTTDFGSSFKRDIIEDGDKIS